MRKHHKLIALLLVIFSVLSVSLNAQDYVLCVGADGHTALETAAFGNCDNDSGGAPWATRSPSLAATTPPVIEAQHCGPCLDVSPAYDWGTLRPRHDEQSVSLVTSILPTIVVTAVQLPERTLNTHRIVDTPPRISELILHHRTTVLLI